MVKKTKFGNIIDHIYYHDEKNIHKYFDILHFVYLGKLHIYFSVITCSNDSQYKSLALHL